MLIDKKDLPLVDMDFMNNTHFEDVDIINELYEDILNYEKDNSSNNYEKLGLNYTNWLEHTKKHFETEEIQMIEKGFFAYAFHKNEHDINLDEITKLWNIFEEDKEIKKLRFYFENILVSWLINHIQTMDTVTARFFKTGISPCSMG
jgi:hemerythrin